MTCAPVSAGLPVTVATCPSTLISAPKRASSALVSGAPLSHAVEGLAAKSGVWCLLRGLAAKVSRFSTRMADVESGLRGHLWPIAAIVLTCFIAAHGGRLGSNLLMNAHFGEKRFPIKAVDYLAADPDATPVFAPDYWGGYLIYHLYPRVLAVVDDRHDLYGEEFLKSYLKTMRGQPGWDDFLKQHHIRRVLVPEGSPLDNLLRETDQWKITYSDADAVVFESQ